MEIKLAFRYLLVTVLLSLSFSILIHAADGGGDTKKKLKEYFLFNCIVHGYRNIPLSNYDHSLAAVADELTATFDEIQAISKLARDVASAVPTSNLTGKKGVLYECLSKYESEDLDARVSSILKAQIPIQK